MFSKRVRRSMRDLWLPALFIERAKHLHKPHRAVSLACALVLFLSRTRSRFPSPSLSRSLAFLLSRSLAPSFFLSLSLSLSLSHSHTHMLGARNKKTLSAAHSSTLTTSKNRHGTRHDEACMEWTMLHGMHLLFWGGRNYWCTHQWFLRTTQAVHHTKNGLVPRVLPVKWHITKEKYDRK